MRRDSHNIEDRILLKKACHDACSQSLEMLYNIYKPFLADYIADKVHFQGDVQDIVHAVFLHLCQGKCQYTGDSDVQGYLCGIAKNVLRDYFKAKRRQIRACSIDDIEIAGDLLTVEEDPAENLQKQEILVKLKEAIPELPSKSREAIELVYYKGLKPFEAAQEAGCSYETFRKRLELARTLLRRVQIDFSEKD
jgi:RNA polymerase sigma-70 factor (ECF subfamily)